MGPEEWPCHSRAPAPGADRPGSGPLARGAHRRETKAEVETCVRLGGCGGKAGGDHPSPPIYFLGGSRRQGPCNLPGCICRVCAQLSAGSLGFSPSHRPQCDVLRSRPEGETTRMEVLTHPLVCLQACRSAGAAWSSAGGVNEQIHE